MMKLGLKEMRKGKNTLRYDCWEKLLFSVHLLTPLMRAVKVVSLAPN